MNFNETVTNLLLSGTFLLTLGVFLRVFSVI